MGCLFIFILMIVVLMVVMLSTLALAVSGTFGMILFGDVIVCIVFIVWLVKKIRRRR